MFEALTKGFREAKNRLSGLAELDESNIKPALNEVRLSLLEADVEIGVVKRFLARVEQKAVGQTVQTRVKHGGETHRVSAEDQFVKICNDELIEMMKSDAEPTVFADKGKRTGVMMVGLQGSGKTTTAAKLARWFEKQDKKPMLVAADMQRPAAVEQLKVLGEQIGIPVFNVAGAAPLDICKQADEEAKKLGRDVIIYDTAGRLAIDEPLMQELAAIKGAIQPANIYLVIDSMIGQDAVQTAKAFNERLGITGVVLTKLDGDARGGAALSVREVTGAPIVFSGVGETLDKLEPFRPEGMASRVLGMGDVVGLIQDFEQVVDQKKAEEDALRMMSGEFTLEDFLNQVRMIQQMGSLKDLVEKIPGMGGMIPPGVNLDDKELVRIQAMIQSMTVSERKDPHSLIREPGRVKRIAKGSAQPEQGVVELIQKFLFMKQMMGSMGGMGDLGLLGKIPGMKNIAAARQVRKAMKGGGMPGMGMPGMGMPGMGMPGMPGMGMPGMGFPGMGMPGMGMPGAAEPPKMRQLSKAEKNAKKADRKRERAARKKQKGKK
ncbi:MAG: signal recognition particle protein [Polyangiaceae bacterium]